jgi:hypothetical protein
MPLLLLMVVIACVFSFVLAFITKISLVVQVKNPPNKVLRKDKVEQIVRIKNNFILPLTPIRVYVKVCEKGIHKPVSKMVIISVPSLGEVTLDIQNTLSFRGEYLIGIEWVEFFDILKIYRFRIGKKKLHKITSYPRELTLNRLRDDNQDETEVSRTKPHDFNKDSFAHLREYREGESLRHIHWKLSARSQDLIVKQMESNHDYSALVFCDFTGRFNSIQAALNASDTAIETSLAVIRRILLSGNSALFLWQDSRTGKGEREEITNLHNCGDLNRSLALLPAEPFDGDFVELFNENQEEIRLERAVYIVTASLDNELVEKLRSTGLIFRTNAVLTVIESPLNQKPLIEYLTAQTKITVCCINSEDDCETGQSPVVSLHDEDGANI